MGGCGDLWDEGKEVVVVVGCWDKEIARGVGVLPPRDKYRAYMLSIAWPLKLHGGGCRGSILVGVDIRAEVVGGRDAEIGWG